MASAFIDERFDDKMYCSSKPTFSEAALSALPVSLISLRCRLNDILEASPYPRDGFCICKLVLERSERSLRFL